jgi:DNA polymerase-1
MRGLQHWIRDVWRRRRAANRGFGIHPSPQWKRAVAKYIADIETNGLLPELDRVHCLVLKDIDTGELYSYGVPMSSIEAGVKRLMEADLAVFHNGIGFDIPALQKVYPWFEIDRRKVYDTIVSAKLYEGNVKERDFLNANRGKYPKQLYGRQSIEAWGYRFGIEKVGIDIKDWSTWTQYMEDRCVSDVEVNAALWKHIEKHARWPVAEKLEHDAAWLCSQIERNGIPFDVDGAAKLYAELVAVRERLSNDLRTLFPCWTVFQGEYTSKANNSKTGHTKGAVYSKVLINEFNPQSRDHIANRLKAKYGWEPVRVHRRR